MTLTQTARRLALVGVFALMMSLLPLAGASAITGDNAFQLTAADNVATSIANSQVLYTPISASHDGEGDDQLQDGPTEALIGRADLFADNLAAGALQGQALANGRPLFLNDQDEGVNADVLAELGRLLPEGSTVHILGGLAAQGEGVETALTDAGFTVNRFAGETRTETAIEIFGATGADTALLVRSTGEGSAAFADSMGAGALAANNGWGVLFTQTSQLTPSTSDFLMSDDAPSSVVVVGGEEAISAEAYDAVVAILGEDNVSRVAGEDRVETAIELNGQRTGDLGSFAILVDGYADDAWADGFTMANLSGDGNYPLVLSNNTLETPEVPQASEEYLTSIVDEAAFAAHFDNVVLVCGASAETADNSVCQEALTAAGGTGTVDAYPPVEDPTPPGPTPNTTGLTDRPELETATVGDLVTASQATATNPAGLRVTYDFDEDIATATATSFHLHASNGMEYPGSGVASIDTTDRSMVTVNFPTVTSATTQESLTLATSNQGAGIDFQGVASIVGDYPIGSADTTGAGAAGTTAGPDLLSVGNFRTASESTKTAIDLTFDENTWVSGATSDIGELIHSDATTGTDANTCRGPNGVGDSTASGGTVPGGNGTTVLTIVCENDNNLPATSTTTLSAANYNRFKLDAGTVRDTAAGTTNNNVLSTAQVTGGASATTGPDLISGSFAFDVTNGTDPCDGAVFTFDNTISTVNTPTSLLAYNADGTTVPPATAAPCLKAPEISGGQVLAYYDNGALANAVGLIVSTQAAVTDAALFTNEFAEIGVENSTTADRTPGATSDPELTSVMVNEVTPTIGSASNVGVYTFDEDVSGTAANINDTFFSLFQADGDELMGKASACSRGTTEDTDNIITCSTFTLNGSDASSAEVGLAVVGSADRDAVRTDGGLAQDSNPGSEPVS